VTQRSSIPLRVLIWRVFVVAVIATALLVVNFSYPLADWWAKHVDIAGRPATGQLDVHVVLWFVLGLLVAVMATRWLSVGSRPTLLVLWLTSIAIEIMQPHLTVRTFEWTDLIGNTIGLSLAGLALERVGPLRRAITQGRSLLPERTA
jgi:hypothetical protein